MTTTVFGFPAALVLMDTHGNEFEVRDALKWDSDNGLATNLKVDLERVADAIDAASLGPSRRPQF